MTLKSKGEVAKTNLVTNNSLHKSSTHCLSKNCLKSKAVTSWRARRNIKLQCRLWGGTTQVLAGRLTERSRISEYPQTFHSVLSRDLTTSQYVNTQCIKADIFRSMNVFDGHRDTLLRGSERRRVERIKHTASSPCTGDKKSQQKWGEKNPKTLIRKLQRTQETIRQSRWAAFLSAKRITKAKRIQVFQDSTWKGPEARLLLTWALLTPNCILTTCKLKSLHLSIHFLSVVLNKNHSRFPLKWWVQLKKALKFQILSEKNLKTQSLPLWVSKWRITVNRDPCTELTEQGQDWAVQVNSSKSHTPEKLFISYQARKVNLKVHNGPRKSPAETWLFRGSG